MGKTSSYVSHQPDAAGRVRYGDDEHAIWAELYARQTRAIADVACPEFLHGLELLQLPQDRVPQLDEVSRVLRRETGWAVEPVAALIPFSEFFALLAERKFPAATFVRRREELDYLQEPDIFHEIFGHTPLLTNPAFAEFTQTYGRLGLAASKEDRVFLARLYWFTVEFGLVAASHPEHGNPHAKDGASSPAPTLKIYGGGILSSIGETAYALGPVPQRRRFDVVEALRTPYRIDIMQPLYYVLDSLDELQRLARSDLMASVAEARRLGLQAPLFAPKAAAAPNLRAA